MAISLVTNEDNMAMMSRYPDKFFEVGCVDPPYGINYANTAAKVSGMQPGRAAAKKRTYKASDWDISIPDVEYFNELNRVCKNVIIWGGNYFAHLLPPSPAYIVWNKDNGLNKFSDCELAYTSFEGALRMVKVTWNGMIQQNMKTKEDRFHPTQKPKLLYEWIFKNYCNHGDKILDTHLGSGSSRIAAHDLGFDFYGCELDKDYFDAQEARFERHISQIKPFDIVEPAKEQTHLF